MKAYIILLSALQGLKGGRTAQRVRGASGGVEYRAKEDEFVHDRSADLAHAVGNLLA